MRRPLLLGKAFSKDKVPRIPRDKEVKLIIPSDLGGAAVVSSDSKSIKKDVLERIMSTVKCLTSACAILLRSILLAEMSLAVSNLARLHQR